MIKRILENQILEGLNSQKVSLLVGARRVGKTSLLENLNLPITTKKLWLNGDDLTTQRLLEEKSISNYRRVLENTSLLIIDEATYIPDIGEKVKLMIDHIKPLHIILSASSSFHLLQSGEPLVGRSLSYLLYPLSHSEYKTSLNVVEQKEQLEERLILGSYPELFSLPSFEKKAAYLKELANMYLLRDILSFEQIRNPKVLRDLLVLISLQIGSEVSSNELSKTIGISKNTVDRFLDLLEKSFVLFSRKSYSNNLRKEISKGKKWYFYDNGIRNALIGNFNLLSQRTDVGKLWEQYVLTERLKKIQYENRFTESFFWRTYDQQEVDLIEVENSSISAFECKWKEAKINAPVSFRKNYPNASFETISQNNYDSFVSYGATF